MFGWIIRLFVLIFIIYAHTWWMIIFANVLLGINQGLTWSMTVNMKIDLSKANQRGAAVGLNKFAGYLGMAIMAAISGYIASSYSLRPEPFYLGIEIVIIGILLSLVIKDTEQHLNIQIQNQTSQIKNKHSLSSRDRFMFTT